MSMPTAATASHPTDVPHLDRLSRSIVEEN
jgi:hypothetical protein